MMKLGLLCCGAAMVACASTPRPGALAVERAAPPPTETDRQAAAIVAAAGEVVSAITIGHSRDGRPVTVLRLGEGGELADRRAALLIVAGTDPMHEIGTTVALGVAGKLAAEHRDLLRDTTVYILPSLNADAAEWLRAGGVLRDHSRTLTPDDADRDGRTDEDGPADLNGDGVISMMRLAAPRPGSGLDARFLVDGDDPRLLREPDTSKNERATHAVIVESADADGDGLFAEDAPGGVDLDSNFPHRWPEFRDGAGPTPLSEPESLAVARWILAPTGPGRDNILAVLVYAPADNLLSIPQTGRNDETGRVPLGIDDGDKAVYEQIGASFKDITGMTGAPKGDDRWPGSLASWAYGQVGAYAFTTPVWVRPDQVKKPEPPQGDAAPDEKPADEAAAATDEPAQPEASPEAPPAPRANRGGRGRAGRGGGGNAGGGGGAALEGGDDAKWLAYFDERTKDGGDPGFIDWAPFEHPQLGPVEIGGFIPGARLNPPASEVDRLVNEQTAFVADLLGRFPRLTISEPVAERLAPGLWRITVRIVNDGRLPTRSAMGVRTRRLPPIRLSVDLPSEAVVGGDRVQRTQSIDGAGGAFTASWVVAAPDGSDVTIQLRSAELGDRDMTLPLAPNAGPKEDGR